MKNRLVQESDPMHAPKSFRKGPLRDVRVVEFAGLGPASFAGMLLADLGADVVRIDRPGVASPEAGATLRGRIRLAIDLREPAGREQATALIANADVVIEGFRPGVMERLGLGPEEMLTIQPRLVYGRMTGWGQHGPRAQSAGHDINFIAVAGALNSIGDGGAPCPPLNLVGDYGGGALYLVMGILAAVLDARRSGEGQVIDCAICDGVVSLLSLTHGLLNENRWNDEPFANVLDGAAPFYRTYECADGRFLAVGAIEPAFYEEWLTRAGLANNSLFKDQRDPSKWDAQRAEAARTFALRTLDEWMDVFANCDACVTPVLSFEESREEPHLVARGAFTDIGGYSQPAPCPRFSKTPTTARASMSAASVQDVLADWCRTV
ncbi:CaiB/BaiF CoA transferase family protein [Achromobacter sp. NPDC058515]|uniref:CaiB/BaiF CoA transferase family protein n=1 Tax=Achromobacter sp. NPDC058515 TaxID=3346533 RepID=UPI003646B051